MRIRALKPGFFKNEQLAELSPWHRLCFEGLWCCADREGRLQDRPKRLKAEIFPYDDLSLDLLLWDLTRTGFIRRYVIASQPLIDIPSWERHQHPRNDEALSELAAYVNGADRPTSSLDATTYPAARPIDTVPSLPSRDTTTPARMGIGILELGSGDLDLGHGTRDSGSGANAPPPPAAAGSHGIRAQDLLDLWNATTKPPLPRCRELTDDRRRKIRLRLTKRPSLAEWRAAFEAIQASAYCLGQNDRDWVANFDWVIRNDTIIARVLERAQTQITSPISVQGQQNAAVLARVAARYQGT